MLKLESNIQALGAQRRLNDASRAMSDALERLSSGMRINKASDDAAGLAIASALNSDRRVFTQGVRNLNDGIGLLNVADGAIEQLSTIVTRLSELAEQAANGTYGVKQRAALDAEAQALSDEYFRIVRSTKFNGRGLFYSEFGELRLQAGYGIDGGIQSGLGGAIGTGTFTNIATYFGPQNAEEPKAFALVDVNGDGFLDSIQSGDSRTVAVRLGNGAGGFGSSIEFDSAPGVNGIGINNHSVADFNGDGILDLAFAINNVSPTAGLLSVALGNGNGTFKAVVTYATQSNQGVSAGDVNGDGVIDLISSGTNGAGSYTVHLGIGDGTFNAGTAVTVGGGGLGDAKLADVTGDGILDLLYSQSGAVHVTQGRGDGTFGTAVSYAMDTAISELDIADVNNDGVLDIVTAGDSGPGTVFVRLGDGNGAFGASTSYLMAASETNGVALGDLNGDGFLDLVAAGQTAGFGVTVVRLGQGGGTFGSAITYQGALAGSGYEAALGDVNGDGVFDIVTSYEYDDAYGYFQVYTGNTTHGISPLLPFDLSTLAGARQALPFFRQSLERLTLQRSTIGAFQSRISFAASALQASADNSGAAAQRILDADIAAESAELIRSKILREAAAAVLAQANLQPRLVLKLLGE